VQKLVFVAMVLGGAMAASGAWAQATTPTATPVVQAAPAEDPNEIVCKSGEPTVGTRLPSQRQCHTRKQWAQIQEDSQRELHAQQMERSATTSSK
jgi:hypothetical protein